MSDSISLFIEGAPVSWKSHEGYGRNSFNPRFKERLLVQQEIQSQLKGKFLEGALKIDVTFFMKTPFYIEQKKERLQKTNSFRKKLYHTKRPDITNLYKFIEDCLKGICFKDDSQIVQVTARKIYSSNPCTEIFIEKVEEFLP